MAVDVAEQKIDAIQEEEEEVEEEEVDEEYEEVEEEPEEEPEEEGGGGSEAEHRAGDYTEAAAATADGADVAVEEAKQSNPASSSSSSDGKIFVGGVSRETTEDNFTKHFEKYGLITDSVIMKDKHTLAPRGFGFVTFADPSVIDKVLADKHVLDGKTVEVKRTVPREDKASKGGIKTKKIFVGGILPTLTEDEFKQHFATYGKVIEHQIMMDHSTRRSRGFGFITFENEAAVEKIISEGKMHDLGGKQVEIKKAEPRKAGADPGFSGRVAYGAAGGGNPLGMLGGGAYGYGGGYHSGVAYYGGRGGGYGYGGAVGYGAGYAPNVGGPMYAAGGYAAGNGYGGQGAYGAYNGYGAGRGSTGRYHPYGR